MQELDAYARLKKIMEDYEQKEPSVCYYFLKDEIKMYFRGLNITFDLHILHWGIVLESKNKEFIYEFTNEQSDMDIKSDFLDLIGRLTNKTRLQNVFQPPGMFFNLMLGDISQDLKNALREQVHMFMENDDLENWCAERYKNKKPPYVYHTINDVRVFLFCINTRYFVGWYTGKQAAVQKLNTMDRTLAIKKWNQIAQFFIEVSAEKQECAI